jgi:hypothetical protein
MARSLILALVLMHLGGVSACGNGDGNGASVQDVLDFVGFSVGVSWSYDVDDTLDGEVRIVGTDPEYVDGVEAYKVEVRIGGFPRSTRWYQVDEQGLFLLGEEDQEGGSLVARTYLNRVKIVPYPLEKSSGVMEQSWTTQTGLEQGGEETHRFDNLGKETIEVPAGTFEVYHLLQTRTDTDGANHQYNHFLASGQWLPQFDFPPGSVWKRR